MLNEQIKALVGKEYDIQMDIVNLEESLKAKKAELTVVKRARKSLESAQKALDGEVVNGQTDILE